MPIRFPLILLAVGLAGCTSMTSKGAPPSTVVKVAAPPSAAPPVAHSRPSAAEIQALEKALREMLLKNVPDPLVKSDRGWGAQKAGLLRRRGSPVLRNDGAWRRFTIRAANPKQTLALGIEDASFPAPGRAAFTVKMGVDCDLKFEQQIWRKGIRLYSGETRGRCRGAVLLKCELTSRTERKPGSLLPDIVLRARVAHAEVFYDKLVIEHTAGLGGEAARLLGEVFVDTLKQAKPGLEKKVLDKANAAIVKAADTRELRLSFDSFLKGDAVVSRAK